MADKEEVEPTAEASSAELSDASETSADLSPSRVGRTARRRRRTTRAATLSRRRSWNRQASRQRPRAPKPRPREPVGPGGPKGAPTNKRDQPVKPERTTPVKFVRQSIGELRKVVYPTGQQLINYFVVVLVFVLFVIAYVSLLDLGLGWAIFKIFS